MRQIVNLKKFDLVLTTSFEFKFGICGHTFEMIDYYCAIKEHTSLNPCILLADGTTKDQLLKAVEEKYDNVLIENIIECYQPKVIIAKNLLITDGSPRLKSADLIVDNVFLFRCSESNLDYFKKYNTWLLQDFEIYDERYEDTEFKVLDYKKKIMFSKYKTKSKAVDNTAMLYLTSLCRQLTTDKIQNILEKYQFKNHIILTDMPELYPNFNTEQVPASDIWNKFSHYIYTTIPRKLDCSSRFIVECEFYNKPVIYDIDYYDRALEVRKKDGLAATVLNKNDYFLELLNEQIKHGTDTKKLLQPHQ